MARERPVGPVEAMADRLGVMAERMAEEGRVARARGDVHGAGFARGQFVAYRSMAAELANMVKVSREGW